jgi:hypothetical protein
MKNSISRKRFLLVATSAGSGLFFSKRIPAQQAEQNPAPLDQDLVKEFVTKGHADLPAVKEMLGKQPRLLNACWDWGGGDFETALEGAGHMGNKEIANFLLENGARINLFCAAMLGKLEVVKAVLAIHPHLKSSKGPHGLQLLHHAKKGGVEAVPVLEYLQSIGAQ